MVLGEFGNFATSVAIEDPEELLVLLELQVVNRRVLLHTRRTRAHAPTMLGAANRQESLCLPTLGWVFGQYRMNDGGRRQDKRISECVTVFSSKMCQSGEEQVLLSSSERLSVQLTNFLIIQTS